MEIKLDLLQTVGLAVCVFLLGRWIKSKVKFFQKYFIPAPVIAEADLEKYGKHDIYNGAAIPTAEK